MQKNWKSSKNLSQNQKNCGGSKLHFHLTTSQGIYHCNAQYLSPDPHDWHRWLQVPQWATHVVIMYSSLTQESKFFKQLLHVIIIDAVMMRRSWRLPLSFPLSSRQQYQRLQWNGRAVTCEEACVVSVCDHYFFSWAHSVVLKRVKIKSNQINSIQLKSLNSLGVKSN